MLGWTETLSAMGGLAYAAMLGLMDILYAKESQPLDIIPVDFVSNQIWVLLSIRLAVRPERLTFLTLAAPSTTQLTSDES